MNAWTHIGAPCGLPDLPFKSSQTEADAEEAKALLVRIVSMLSKMSR
jgi:hypothetical protein